ncbi:glycerol-3-phosphate 1-O-acyltransferase PlsY [Roseomonas xinghualingensis]|uniref:glycerol-3-phosphate 1-O-acyltransferase PlsY n=1 Tax=Roseomonas xinghualingensis TaxID=2986475 RepID=UPI0021F1170D|nr:glycerol-3-phosphate 1-O-acyltransferase PlsY [Roseomonas sp. SXEYE001]MCV4209598.1 glycerol-3-phosphate 1-O-acyltransferase PlsY [Roseomonas sp. SXEYE001]
MNVAYAGILGLLLGSIPFGLILTQAAGLGDIRAIGSGNIGATNVLRTGNKKLAAATLALDFLKGAVAVWIAHAVFGTETAGFAAIGAVLGHCHPPWLAFRGGKGVATALGVFLALAWPVFVAAGLTWLTMAKISRISSASALTGMAVAALVALLWGGWPLFWPVALIVIYVFIRHHANIRRLLAGTEPRIGQGK